MTNTGTPRYASKHERQHIHWAVTSGRRYMGRFGSEEVQFLPFMVIRTAWLAADPATVYHALFFYHAHPDLRAELATPYAVQRIRNGRAVGREEP